MKNALFDPRVKMLMAITIGICIIIVDIKDVKLIIIALSVYLLVQGYILQTLIYLASLSLCYFLVYKLTWINNSILDVVKMTGFMGIKIIPIAMGIYPVIKMSPSIIVTTLNRLKLPREIVIPLTVILRFSPSIKKEFKKISESMILRGLRFSFYNIVRHPIKLIEWSIIPLFMRSIQVSDELATAATLRGIDNPGIKTSHIQLKYKYQDLLLMLFVLSFISFLIYRRFL